MEYFVFSLALGFLRLFMYTEIQDVCKFILRIADKRQYGILLSLRSLHALAYAVSATYWGKTSHLISLLGVSTPHAGQPIFAHTE